MVTKDEILDIALLSKLHIDEDEIDELTQEMMNIIKFAECKRGRYQKDGEYKFYRRNGKMNKSDLVSMIAAKSNLTKKDSEMALNAFVETVQGALKKGEKIQLVGFGTFEVRQRSARNGVNPRTKQSIKIPASKAPVFKAGKALKESCN